jgi:hypothetical protein
MPTTSPDNIYFADGETPLSIQDISAATATSVQVAFDSRQNQNFRWAGAGDRELTENMVIGDLGYNVPDKTQYIYDGVSWKIWNKVRSVYTATMQNFAMTGGATSIVAYYGVSSGFCNIQVLAILGAGSATNIGDIALTLPTGYPVIYPTNFFSNRASLDGTVQMRNASGATIYGGLVRLVSDSPQSVNVLRASGTAGTFAAVSPTAPFSWAVGDQCVMSFSYPVS